MYAREYHFSQLDQVMALHRYLAKEDRSVLPTVYKCGDSSLSRKEVETANERVKQVLGDAKLAPRGKYNDYSAEERAQIGKCAADNDPTKVARHFSQLLERTSSTRTLCAHSLGQALCATYATACFMVAPKFN